MSRSTPEIPFVQSVLHPSDFSEASVHAFAHALAIALRRQAKLTILHVGGDDAGWEGFPAVRETLERWGHLEPGSPRSAVADQLGMKVRKIGMKGARPLDAILGFLDDHPADLIVLATEQRKGLPRWLESSVAERVARRARTMTLFVPSSSPGFVPIENGKSTLKKIVVPIDHEPDPRIALNYAARASALGGGPTEILAVHVGDESKRPLVEYPASPDVTWRPVTRDGAVVDELIGVVQQEQADLIVMGTQGHDGILDALRGSVTEQVLRGAGCPLLAVPIDVD